MADTDCSTLPEGDIRFFDNVIPALPAGDYLVSFSQRLNPTSDPKRDTTAFPDVDETFRAAQVFSVQAPRFNLAGGDLFSCFPPDNAVGIYEQALPHVVFTRRDLPWERDIFEASLPKRRTPWLALLLFSGPDDAGGGQVSTLPASSFIGKGGKPDGSGVLWPDLQAEWHEDKDYLGRTMVNTVAITREAFLERMPGPAALPYLAHARQVNMVSKESGVLAAIREGWYSVLVGSRLPQPGKARNRVHLVSLEGFEACFRSGQVALDPGVQAVRLISLFNWSFTCVPDGGHSFAGLTRNLMQNTDATLKSTRFSLAVEAPAFPTDDEKYASAAMANGFVPLRYHTRPGDRTFAWYRGPFAPLPTQNWVSTPPAGETDPNWQQPFTTASSALIYDPTYGVFDVSYAVAWETGRLLALADRTFGQALFEWQRQGHRLLDLIAERGKQIPELKGFDADNPPAGEEDLLLAAIKPYAVTDPFMQHLLTELATEMQPGSGAIGGADPAPRPPKLPHANLPAPLAEPATIQDLLKLPVVRKTLRKLGGARLDKITGWLAQRYLLKGVPFEALAPLADLLPLESVRFFYLDTNWLDALLEGALSIGIESSRDRAYQELMKDLIWDATHDAVQRYRDLLLGAQASLIPPGATLPLDREGMTGMLLRSALVSDWPGLEFDGYTGCTFDVDGKTVAPDKHTFMKALRIERLAGDVLLCLWPAVPAAVTIAEPQEGIEFGFEDPPQGKGFYIYLRSLQPGAYGQPCCPDPKTTECDEAVDAGAVIDAKTGVVDIAALVGAMEQRLKLTAGTLNVRDFAVQMIRLPEEAIFASSDRK